MSYLFGGTCILFIYLDGHHKLIRWRLVVHGGIDGYSRMVVYLHCSNNNRATTVYNLFLKAVRQYWLPSRVRADHGRENVLVAQHLLEHRGRDRNSFITGSSTHNQRIERFWRDSHRCVTQLYHRLFYFMEYRGTLDPLDEQHIYALHYVYLPRINKSLDHFHEGWNHHAIRTERNMSPYQLFISGALRLQRSGLAALDFFEAVDEEYGLEEEGLVPNEDVGVVVPHNTFALVDEHQQELLQSVNPLVDSNNYGIELYEQTLQFVRLKVHQHPLLYS